MKISVIMSTYNRPHYLERVIEGYMNQTCRDFEIVVADDGSTEETASVVKEAAGKSEIPILHVLHPDKGFRAAKIRNKAAAKSTAKYIIFTDDDCMPSRNFVLDHLSFLEEGYFIQGHRVLLGGKASKKFDFKSINIKRLLLLSLQREAINIHNFFRLPIPLIKKTRSLKGIRSCNMSLFRRDFLAVNGFNEDFEGWGKEDSELVARLYKFGIKRKDIKFRACCFHLHHEFFDRDRLNRNIEILQQSIRVDGYYCKNGVDQYPGS